MKKFVLSRKEPLVVDKNGNFKRIIEAKYINSNEKNITLCNSGIMVFAPGILNKYINKCLTFTNKLQKELYLTQIIEVCVRYNEKVSYIVSKDHHNLIFGINTQKELQNVNNLFNK